MINRYLPINFMLFSHKVLILQSIHITGDRIGNSK